ncbi:hypothetical protein NDU88_003502 [Pleurodeles waltl]|uniref:Uncharacterized protein n=1 Tax=Pleurodeles waltl TaxID=8319 RepID=A0AAV7WV03_PLEWA|nr:hypothetical protein NDU88_003502 [Pleurodeles waltl]
MSSGMHDRVIWGDLVVLILVGAGVPGTSQEYRLSRADRDLRSTHLPCLHLPTPTQVSEWNKFEQLFLMAPVVPKRFKGVQRTLAREQQKTEKELCEVGCGMASGSVKREDLDVLREKWIEVDSCRRQFDYRHYVARTHS